MDIGNRDEILGGKKFMLYGNWTDYKTNTEILKELKIASVRGKINVFLFLHDLSILTKKKVCD